VKDFFKNTASLFLALAILLGILFTPKYEFDWINGFLDFLSKGTTVYSFGNYLVQKMIVGFAIFIIVATLTILSRKGRN